MMQITQGKCGANAMQTTFIYIYRMCKYTFTCSTTILYHMMEQIMSKACLLNIPQNIWVRMYWFLNGKWENRMNEVDLIIEIYNNRYEYGKCGKRGSGSYESDKPISMSLLNLRWEYFVWAMESLAMLHSCTPNISFKSSHSFLKVSPEYNVQE